MEIAQATRVADRGRAIRELKKGQDVGQEVFWDLDKLHEGGCDDVLLTERDVWKDGPPHELFAQMRTECPVHWTSRISEYPSEAGFWSVTNADDVHTVSRDWQTYSSERGGVTAGLTRG